MKTKLSISDQNVDGQLINALYEIFVDDDDLFAQAMNEMQRALHILEQDEEWQCLLLVNECE